MSRSIAVNALDWTKAKTREAKARTRLLDLQHAKESAELWETDAVWELIGQAFGALRSPLLEMGANLGPRVNPADPAMASQILDEEVRRILTNFSNQTASFVPRSNGKKGRQRGKMGTTR